MIRVRAEHAPYILAQFPHIDDAHNNQQVTVLLQLDPSQVPCASNEGKFDRLVALV
jgi:hypothetical protein